MSDNALFIVLIYVVLLAFFVFPPIDELGEREIIFTSEIPEYKVILVDEENQSIKLSMILNESDNRTIPVSADEVEISYFILSEENISILIRDENRDGEWEISCKEGISWTSKNISVDGIVTLPTGEKVTLLGFDPKGNPRLRVIAG